MLWFIISHFAANRGEQMQMQLEHELAQMATRMRSQLTGPQHRDIAKPMSLPPGGQPGGRPSTSVPTNSIYTNLFGSKERPWLAYRGASLCISG